MLLTPAEAADKMCPHLTTAALPFAELLYIALAKDARFTDAMVPRDVTCRGSGCAMWRVVRVEARRVIPAHTPQAMTETEAGSKPDSCQGWDFAPMDEDFSIPAQWIEPHAQASARCLGYCGLAGEPTC